MLSEILDSGKNCKLINSPRVRHEDTKIFYQFGYFTMMYAIVLSKHRLQMININNVLE